MSSSESIAATMFAGIGSAKESFSANYFKAGHYVWLINQIKADKNRAKEAFLVVEATCVHVYDNANDTGHRFREDASWLIMAKQDSFLGNVKTFVAKAMECHPDEVNEQACIALCSDAQPLQGWFVESQNLIVPTKKGGLFTRVNWKGPVQPSKVAELIDDEEVVAVMFPDGLEDE